MIEMLKKYFLLYNRVSYDGTIYEYINNNL